MFAISEISDDVKSSAFLSLINVKYNETTKSTKEKRNNKKIIKSFFFELSMDFATNDATTGVTVRYFLSFLGLPGQAFLAVFGFLETNSFFGLPGAFFFLFCGIPNYLRGKFTIYLFKLLIAFLVAGPKYHRTSGLFSYPLSNHLLRWN